MRKSDSHQCTILLFIIHIYVWLPRACFTFHLEIFCAKANKTIARTVMVHIICVESRMKDQTKRIPVEEMNGTPYATFDGSVFLSLFSSTFALRKYISRPPSWLHIYAIQCLCCMVFCLLMIKRMHGYSYTTLPSSVAEFITLSLSFVIPMLFSNNAWQIPTEFSHFWFIHIWGVWYQSQGWLLRVGF